MSHFQRILTLAKPYWRQLSSISLIIVSMSVLKQVEPLVLKKITDTITSKSGGSGPWLSQTIIIMLALYLSVKVLSVILNRLSWYLTTLFTQKFRNTLRETGYAHLMKLPMSYFNRKQSGQLMSKLDRGSAQVTAIINNSGMYFVPNVLSAVIGLFIVLRFNVYIGIGLVTAFIPVGIINYWKFTKNQKLERKEWKLYDRQYGHFWETISGIKLIKSFVAEKYEENKLKQFNSRIIKIIKKIEHNHNLFTISDALLEIWIWFIYAWVVYLTYQGKFSLGTMVLMLSYVGIIREPLWTLNWVFWEAKRAQIGARDFFKILDEVPSISSPLNPKPLNKIFGHITFNKVAFSYPKGSNVFNDVSFRIKPGTTCALVGRSGAGKTTVADLLCRFFDPQEGSIAIDSIDIKNVRVSDLRQNIGFVSQEAYLFDETIAENLRYGNQQASIEDMKLACSIANADEFIDKLPKGYMTKLGERGVKLSGGQKQRLSLARVILKNPKILILDEATSQLDSYSEMLIQNALEKITHNRTTIIIAHRLSTIQKADQIIVLDKGKILEQGTHSELLENRNLYASLFSIQTGNREALKEWGLVNN